MKLKYLFWALFLSSLSFCACDILGEEEDGVENDIPNNQNNEGSKQDDDSSRGESGVSADAEVNAAFVLLNAMRNDPESYSTMVGFDLSGVKSLPSLKWNSALAKVAQQKADDMVKRGYFSHTDPDGYGVNYFINQAGYTLNPSWYSSKSLNYFESIAAGKQTGKQTIVQLVYDSGNANANAGHRSHLLGISEWNASLTDIGIGHAYGPNTQYKHYWSFIIAKHDY